MSVHPAPLEVGDSPREIVSWQDMFDAADSERFGAGVRADELIRRANTSDQQSERERDTARRVARSQRRREAIFLKLARLIAWCETDEVIRDRLYEIAAREAREAAERETDVEGETTGANE